MDDERRRLIEQCGDGMMAIKEGRIDYANEAAAALAKASDRHALAGRALAELLPHYPLPRGQEQQASAPQTNTEGQLSGEPSEGPARFVLHCLDGSLTEVEISEAVLPGRKRGRHAGASMVLRMVDARGDEIAAGAAMAAASPAPADVGMGAPRCTQVRRQRQAQEFKTMVENSPDAILRFDRMMRYMYVNPAIEAITGLKPEDYAGKTNAELGLPEDFVIACDRAVRTALDSGTEQSFDFEFGNQQEKRFYCARVLPEAAPNGSAGSALAIIYDITSRKKMESEHQLLLARERSARIQAETAARARDEFLAIVSHELRAPLNGIQSWGHILENYVKDAVAAPLAQRALAGIRTGVAQQVRLIEDLLDVTRMMSGRLSLVKQPITLLPIIQAALESVRAAAAAKHIAIHCSCSITTEQIDGDPDRVQQIIWNLLCNAVKFTPDNGHIWISASIADNQVLITVRDDGIGIAPDFLPYLFDRFSQKDTSSTRGHSGLGLGLFLVHRLTELHGGSIKAESGGEGKGSSFSLQFPLRAYRSPYLPAMQSENDEARSQLPSLKGLRILLIDDQEEVRESLAIMLSTAGAKVFASESAQRVLDWLPAAAEDELPHILICDIAMPMEDGYSALRRLRSWSNGSDPPMQRIPALALTAFAQREDRIKALTAGFQMHLTKPVAPEELIIVIAMLASRR